MNSFGRNAYYWRRLSPAEREKVLALRKAQHRPWHSPPHATEGGRYLLTAACYEHAPVIGDTGRRLADFEEALLECLGPWVVRPIHAWVVLPNHYHVLASVADTEAALHSLGQLHGRTAFAWNGADGKRDRKVWCGAEETRMKSERHFWASMNYIHHNPVKHGYVTHWTDWPFSSAAAYLQTVGRERAEAIWREYDISDMGADWDP